MKHVGMYEGMTDYFYIYILHGHKLNYITLKIICVPMYNVILSCLLFAVYRVAKKWITYYWVLLIMVSSSNPNPHFRKVTLAKVEQSVLHVQP